MEGWELHEIWVELHLQRNILVDKWEELEEHDQEVWNALAARLEEY